MFHESYNALTTVFYWSTIFFGFYCSVIYVFVALVTLVELAIRAILGLRLVLLSQSHGVIFNHLGYLVCCRGLLVVRVSIAWFAIIVALILFLWTVSAAGTSPLLDDGIKCVMANFKDRIASILCKVIALQNGHVKLSNFPFEVSCTIIRQQFVLV